MSTTYMVKSSLIFLACHINVVLMTILLLFNVSKSTHQHYMLNVFQIMLYMLGVIFNVYVVLYASRKWELVMKYFENGTNYLLMMKDEIMCNISNCIQVSVQQMLAAVNCILEAFNQDSEASVSTGRIYSLAPNGEETTTAKLSALPPQEEERTARIQVRQIFKEEDVCKMQATSEEKTPELKTAYNLKPVNRPKSDPIKSFRNEIVKGQSPELLKNKIFKSRMILTCDSPVSRTDTKRK